MAEEYNKNPIAYDSQPQPMSDNQPAPLEKVETLDIAPDKIPVSRWDDLVKQEEKFTQIGSQIVTTGGTTISNTSIDADPAGSNRQIQFNDNGNFGADADFTWNKTTNTLLVDGTIKGDSAGGASLTIDGEGALSLYRDESATTQSGSIEYASDLSLNITTGNADDGGASQDPTITINAGDAIDDDSVAGSIILNAGVSSASAYGGSIEISAGQGAGTGYNGGDVTITSGVSQDGTSDNGRIVFGPGASLEVIYRGGSTTTTNATPKSVPQCAELVSSGTAFFVEATVVARRTGGTAGSAGDCAAYIRRGLYKNTGAGATLVGSVQDAFTSESQAGWDCTLVTSGDTVSVQVTGAADNSIRWNVEVKSVYASN